MAVLDYIFFTAKISCHKGGYSKKQLHGSRGMSHSGAALPPVESQHCPYHAEDLGHSLEKLKGALVVYN